MMDVYLYEKKHQLVGVSEILEVKQMSNLKNHQNLV
jgi:hypothetical protein